MPSHAEAASGMQMTWLTPLPRCAERFMLPPPSAHAACTLHAHLNFHAGINLLQALITAPLGGRGERKAGVFALSADLEARQLGIMRTSDVN